MKRGQVSFDFILAVIVALVFISGLQLLNTEIQQTQKFAAVRNQEKAIALQVHGIISTAKILDEAGAIVDIEYETVKMLVPGEAILSGCTIDLQNKQVIYNLNGTNVVTNIPDFDAGNLIIPNQVDCGDMLSITK